MCSIVVAAFIFLIVLPFERVFLVLASMPPFCSKLRVSLSDVELLVLLQKSRNRKAFPAGHAGPGLFASVRSFVHVEMGRKLVRLPTNVAAERTLVGVKSNVDLKVADLGECLLANAAAVRSLSGVDPKMNSQTVLA